MAGWRIQCGPFSALDRLMIEYCVNAVGMDGPVSLARCKDALLMLDTNAQRRPDAFNSVELFLASLAACMIESIGCLAPQLHFQYRALTVSLRAVEQRVPPKITRVEYLLNLDTEESAARLEILHLMVRTHGAVCNTVARDTDFVGKVSRMSTNGRNVQQLVIKSPPAGQI